MHTLTLVFRLLLFILLCVPVMRAMAQTRSEQTGWLAWFNSYKFSEHWGTHLDVQVRSADDWSYARNLLIRPGITYHFNARHNATAGYALIKTYTGNNSPLKNLTEHRIWEQYIYAHKIKGLPLSHRLRLEQRFIERTNDDLFSQRFRYFARLIVPLPWTKENFTSGPFAAVQNELFLNVQNKDRLNNHVFDQNRAYIAVGYRLSTKADVEAGYLNQYIKGAGSNTRNHVVQVAVYTRF